MVCKVRAAIYRSAVYAFSTSPIMAMLATESARPALVQQAMIWGCMSVSTKGTKTTGERLGAALGG